MENTRVAALTKGQPDQAASPSMPPESMLYKHSFKAPARQLTSVSVYNAGLQRCESGYAWGPGSRDHYLIHYVTAGKGSYAVGERTYALSEGDMFLACPHEMIAYRADSANPWSYCWVGFGGLDAGTLIGQTDFSAANRILHIDDMETPRSMLMDIYASRGARPHEIAQMTGKLYAFLAWLMEGAQEESTRRRQAGLEHVERACAFIANNYTSAISVSDIARNVGVCRSLLNRAFQRHLGLSPIQHLTQYRMQQASRMLRKTDMTIKAVAYSVGFEDPLYFSRRFREIMGCSPREYVQREAPDAPEDA